jgi:hypothetical protein
MKSIIGRPKEIASMLFALEQDKEYEIKEYKPLRGANANRYFHKLVNELARYNRSTGFAISDDEMKIEINIQYGTIATNADGHTAGAIVPAGANIRRFYSYVRKYKSDDKYDYYIFYKRTHELDSKEFTQLIRGLERECKDVGIPTLDDIEFERMMSDYEKECKKCKQR